MRKKRTGTCYTCVTKLKRTLGRFQGVFKTRLIPIRCKGLECEIILHISYLSFLNILLFKLMSFVVCTAQLIGSKIKLVYF